jgi:hypothetical protein
MAATPYQILTFIGGGTRSRDYELQKLGMVSQGWIVASSASAWGVESAPHINN